MLWICDLNTINTNAVNTNGWVRGSKHEKGRGGGGNKNRKASKRDGQARGGSGDSF